uniref:Uncharacterized protein n=1 Tax=Rousettus aegyptiacus TaxID=9407 RepID=A0A7J8BEE0_ROUAE|nr:hypothetical protein HJG63_009879 [Rousettus aegyptiacus]
MPQSVSAPAPLPARCGGRDPATGLSPSSRQEAAAGMQHIGANPWGPGPPSPKARGSASRRCHSIILGPVFPPSSSEASFRNSSNKRWLLLPGACPPKNSVGAMLSLFQPHPLPAPYSWEAGLFAQDPASGVLF